MVEAATLTRNDIASLIWGGNMNCPVKVAIIGGGTSGVATLATLCSALESQGRLSAVSIDIIDPKGVNGRGVPYSAPRGKSPAVVSAWENLTLNVKAIDMTSSIAAGVGFNFCQWLNQYHPGFEPGDYVPRSIFGDFMEERTTAFISEWRKKGAVINTHVLKVADEQPGYYQPNNENTAAYDFVFNATGHVRAIKWDHLNGKKGYFPTAYNLPDNADSLPAIDGQKRLVIFGGESSIADFVAVTEALGYKGEYVIITNAAQKLEDCYVPPSGCVPKGHAEVIKVRDQGRMEIINGFVDGSDILPLDDGGFEIKFTRMEWGEVKEECLYATNVINAGMWEKNLTYSAGHYVDDLGEVHRLNTDFTVDALIGKLQKNNMVHPDSNGMPVEDCEFMHLVGSPLMAGRDGVAEKQWSVMHCWSTAHDAVQDFTANKLGNIMNNNLTYKTGRDSGVSLTFMPSC